MSIFLKFGLLLLCISSFFITSNAQDSLKTIPLKNDSTQVALLDSSSASSKKVGLITLPVSFKEIFPSNNQILNDSLARWYPWNTFDELLFWTEGLHHFRTPSFIRPTYSLFSNTSNATIAVDGLATLSPLGTLFSTSLIPIQSLSSINKSSFSDFHFQTIRLVQPKAVTQLFAEESGFGYLNVYGSLYTPISKNQHLDISLWNRSESEEFDRSESRAKTMFVRYRYQLDDFRQLEASVTYNSVQMNEPDGYYVEPISFFDFNRFNTRAHRRNAHSSLRNSLYRVDFYQSNSNTLAQLSAFAQLGRRFFFAKKDSLISSITTVYPADSVDIGYNQFGIQTSSKINLLGLPYRFSSTINYNTSNQDAYTGIAKRQLNSKNWFQFSWTAINYFNFGLAQLNTSHQIDFISLTGLSYKLGQELVYPISSSKFSLRFILSQKQQPVYSKYLESLQISSANLPAVQTLGAGIGWKWNNQQLKIQFDTDGSYQTGEYGLKNNQFVVTDPQIKIASSISEELSFWKLSLTNSTTATQYIGKAGFWPEQLLLWNRTRIYHEDYWFSRATYIRTGFSAIVSPFAYATPSLNVVYNDWIQADEANEIPGFFRLDYELTARVRALFIYFRWENITQGLLQNGYFETYSYPMYERRLRFGIKVQFIN